VFEGVLLIVAEYWKEAFSLPCRQLSGLEVKNPEKVLTGISGHGGISVGRVSLVWWNVKLYSEYAVRMRANQDRLRYPAQKQVDKWITCTTGDSSCKVDQR
jgi:hypothetical protein